MPSKIQNPKRQNTSRQSLTLEGVKLIFRNFSGAPGRYNEEGERSFSILIPTTEMANQVIAAGYNVKYTKPRGEDDLARPYLPVKIQYPNAKNRTRPPQIVIIKDEETSALDETSVHILDWAEIIEADVRVNPYDWSVNGLNGRSAYLSALYATLRIDPLEAKYRNLKNNRG